jgi:hypothetical protein
MESNQMAGEARLLSGRSMLVKNDAIGRLKVDLNDEQEVPVWNHLRDVDLSLRTTTCYMLPCAAFQMIEAEGTVLPKPGTKAKCGADTDARNVVLLVRAGGALGANGWVLGSSLRMVVIIAAVLGVAQLNAVCFHCMGC